MAVTFVPRSFGGTLVLNATVIQTAPPPTVALTATGRDGKSTAIGRDGKNTAVGRG